MQFLNLSKVFHSPFPGFVILFLKSTKWPYNKTMPCNTLLLTYFMCNFMLFIYRLLLVHLQTEGPGKRRLS